MNFCRLYNNIDRIYIRIASWCYDEKVDFKPIKEINIIRGILELIFYGFILIIMIIFSIVWKFIKFVERSLKNVGNSKILISRCDK